MQVIGLLVIAAVVAIMSARRRAPYAVGLVLAGLLVGFAPLARIELSRELIFSAFLPPLLFDAAINMNLLELRRRWLQVTVLALPGTLLTAAVVALGLHLAAHMSLPHALVLGVILAPTDPVSVLATFKENSVASGLRTLVEGESIFNDALGVVLFVAAVTYVFPGSTNFDATYVAVHLLGEVAIGAAVGLSLGFVVHRLMRTIDDHLVEITLSVTAAFGTALIADRLGGSGIIATVTAGLFVSNYQPHVAQGPVSRQNLFVFWETIAFLLNSVIFLLIGMQPGIRFAIANQATALAVVVATAALLLGRAIVTYGLLTPFRHAKRAPVASPWLHAVFWGGLRGTIPVALVLGLTPDQRQFESVDATGVVYGVVLLSIVGQGLTFRPLLRRAGLINATEPE